MGGLEGTHTHTHARTHRGSLTSPGASSIHSCPDKILSRLGPLRIAGHLSLRRRGLTIWGINGTRSFHSFEKVGGVYSGPNLGAHIMGVFQKCVGGVFPRPGR